MNCRTAVLGGFKAHCDHCGAETIQYASCRNRHCPKCQTLAQTRWVERQCADLLDIGYWHVVFTLPHDLNPVAQGNPALIYRLLFKAASQPAFAASSGSEKTPEKPKIERATQNQRPATAKPSARSFGGQAHGFMKYPG